MLPQSIQATTRTPHLGSLTRFTALLGALALSGCAADAASGEEGGAGGSTAGSVSSGGTAGTELNGASGAGTSGSAGSSTSGTTSVSGSTSGGGTAGDSGGLGGSGAAGDLAQGGTASHDDTAGASGDGGNPNTTGGAAGNAGAGSGDDDAGDDDAGDDDAGDDDAGDDDAADDDAADDDAADDDTQGGAKGTSAGCGTPTSLTSGNASISVDGTQRDYILKLPDGYDPSQPYKLVFGLHWRGGQASDVSNGTIGLGDYYGLDALAQGSAVFVSPNGIDNGWANSQGRDIAFMRELMALFDAELCIDLDRVFSVGFSYGGMMSFAIACEMADVFRAIAPLSGALYSGCGNGTEPIAMWGAHGQSDDVVPIGDGRAGLQEVLDRNHCGSETVAVDPSPCQTYQGCDEGYPVTWCEFSGGHSPQGWQSQPIWDFFSQF